MIKSPLSSGFFSSFALFCLFYQTALELSRNATFAVTPWKTGAKLGQLPAKDKMKMETTILHHAQITCKVSKDTEIWLSGRYREIKACGKKGRKHMGCRDHMGSGRAGRTAGPQMILRSND